MAHIGILNRLNIRENLRIVSLLSGYQNHGIEFFLSLWNPLKGIHYCLLLMV